LHRGVPFFFIYTVRRYSLLHEARLFFNAVGHVTREDGVLGLFHVVDWQAVISAVGLLWYFTNMSEFVFVILLCGQRKCLFWPVGVCWHCLIVTLFCTRISPAVIDPCRISRCTITFLCCLSPTVRPPRHLPCDVLYPLCRSFVVRACLLPLASCLLPPSHPSSLRHGLFLDTCYSRLSPLSFPFAPFGSRQQPLYPLSIRRIEATNTHRTRQLERPRTLRRRRRRVLFARPCPPVQYLSCRAISSPRSFLSGPNFQF
jgi:hypothetical protein